MNREKPHQESCLAAAEHGTEQIVQIDKTAEFVCGGWEKLQMAGGGGGVFVVLGYELWWSGARAMRVFIDDSLRSCLVHIHARCALTHVHAHTHTHAFMRSSCIHTHAHLPNRFSFNHFARARASECIRV